LALGVALDVEVGQRIKSQLRRRGAQRLPVVASFLRRVGAAADVGADALGGGAGLDEGEGGVAAQRDAAERGAAVRAVAEGPGADAGLHDAEAEAGGLAVPEFKDAGFGWCGGANAGIRQILDRHHFLRGLKKRRPLVRLTRARARRD
jgi:hypothetical protein